MKIDRRELFRVAALVFGGWLRLRKTKPVAVDAFSDNLARALAHQGKIINDMTHHYDVAFTKALRQQHIVVCTAHAIDGPVLHVCAETMDIVGINPLTVKRAGHVYSA